MKIFPMILQVQDQGIAGDILGTIHSETFQFLGTGRKSQGITRKFSIEKNLVPRCELQE